MIIENGIALYEYNISSKQFNSIKSNENRIVYFVYNEEVQRITLGEEFLLHDEDDPIQTIKVMMRAAVQLPTFERLLEGSPPYHLSPDESVQEWIAHLNDNSTKKEVEKYGVIGILIEKVE